MRPWIAALWNMPLSRPHGVALVLIYPCGKAQKPPFSLALHRVGSGLAVKGSLRRFAPWTAPGRSERRAAYEGKGEVRAVGREGELAHDKGYYHSCLGGHAESQLSAIPDALSRSRGALSPAEP